MLSRVKTLMARAPEEEAPVDAEAEQQLQLEQLRRELPMQELLQLKGSSELPVVSETDRLTLRYLVAEKRKVHKAAQRLTEQLEWRLQFMPQGNIFEGSIASDLAAHKVLLQPPGPGGRPLLVVIGRNHLAGDFAQTERFIAYCLEAASQLCWDERNPDGKLDALFDLKGLQVRNLDAGALRASFSILNHRYPERIHEIVMYEAPTIFWGLWKVVSPFIDPVSRGKVKFVHGESGRATLLEHVGPETLPAEYGGKAQPRLVQDAVAELPEWLQQRWGSHRVPEHNGHANGSAANGSAASGSEVAPVQVSRVV